LRLRIIVAIDENESMSSVKMYWKTADWFEKEIWDLMGIEFTEQSKERLLNHSQFIGHPLRKDFDVNTRQKFIESEKKSSASDELVIYPRKYSSQGHLKLNLKLLGDDIVDISPRAGLIHRGIEKISETTDYHQFITYTNHLNSNSSSMNNIGWCKAIEEMSSIEVPARAKALRMVFAELSRVVDHSLCIGAMAESVGAMTYQWFCHEIRERIATLFEKFCGARSSLSIFRIGGMAYDLPLGWVSECLDTVTILENKIAELEKLLNRSSQWISRTNVCPVSASSAIEWGYTGPALRACGVNYDIRKVSPYYFYNEVDFEVPLGIDGTTYDRYLVRLEEMKQSLKIISQVLDNVPAGFKINPEFDFFSKGEAFKDKKRSLVEKGILVKAGDFYSFTEAANGELGFYIVSDGTRNPYRVKVRPPSFPIYQSIKEVAIGSNIVDLSVTLDSFNISSSELDR
jgi:NADH-quinone oxidoreductase subunit C/D